MSTFDFPVTELGETDHVEVGETGPDFTRPLVTDEFWEDVALSELTAAGPVALVFHTMDGDFPATYIWQEISRRRWDEYDAAVVGCSISSPYEHSRFIDERRLRHRLFSDPANGVGRAYGIDHDLDGMAGISEPRPAVFVMDESRVIEHAWVATEWPEFPPYDEIESVLEAL